MRLTDIRQNTVSKGVACHALTNHKRIIGNITHQPGDANTRIASLPAGGKRLTVRVDETRV